MPLSPAHAGLNQCPICLRCGRAAASAVVASLVTEPARRNDVALDFAALAAGLQMLGRTFETLCLTQG